MPGLAEDVLELLGSRGVKLATAESCTGGLIAARITEISGASAIFDRGFIVYQNRAKEDMLGVSGETLEQNGAVSAQVAEEMANGAIAHSDAAIAVSVTGIAGPNGGTPQKPVGLVYIGIASRNGSTNAHEHRFKGDRSSVREQTVEAAFKHLLETLKASNVSS